MGNEPDVIAATVMLQTFGLFSPIRGVLRA
jgi:hypothetical protein